MTAANDEATTTAGPGWVYYALVALSLSVGWGIRGNFGHEFGAMIPGALAGAAVALASGREDWQRRVAYFAMFGALGWSFGGSISYMMVIAYTHSGHSPSVLYGFACLFVIGFLWAATGGAGTALAALADRDRLTELFAPMTAVFLVWAVQGTLIEPWLRGLGYSLNWFDTDWPGAFSAVVVLAGWALARRGLDRATSFLLHMALGWWLGFLILVIALGLRMTPPRGDNWAGCLGITAGMLVYLARNGLAPVAQASLVTGVIGGIGFAAASMLKLVEVTSGLDTNWHSVLEQTTGLFNGLALAVAMAGPARRARRPVDEPRTRRWTEVYAVVFVLVLVTYVNARKNPVMWIHDRVMPPTLVGLPTGVWFDLAYLILAGVLILVLARHLRSPLPLLPASPLGKGQWLFLLLLWAVAVINFERAIVGFAAQRLVTEGVIHVNAALCTLMLVLGTGLALPRSGTGVGVGTRPRLGRTAAVGLAAAALAVTFDWYVVRSLYGDRFAGYANLHIRFGPIAKPRP